MMHIDQRHFGENVGINNEAILFEIIGGLIETTAPDNGRIDVPFLSGWDFLFVCESPEHDWMPTLGVAEAEGPVIYFNSYFIEERQMRDTAAAMTWLPNALAAICEQLVLSDLEQAVDGTSKLAGDRWAAFREEVCRHMFMSWEDLLSASEHMGITYLCHSMALALYEESGLHQCLVAQAAGDRQLRIA